MSIYIVLFRLTGFSFLLLSASCAWSQNSVYSLRAKPQKVTAVIMATGASIRQGSGNQEIYLAELTVKDGRPQLAKLVDTYSSSGIPILRSVLVVQRKLRMLITRNPECDTTGAAFFLNGDKENIFDLTTRNTLKGHAMETIPCFTVAHESTRLAK